MGKKAVWLITVIFLYSCGNWGFGNSSTKTQRSVDDLLPDENPPSEAVFDLNAFQTIEVENILLEVAYYPAGGTGSVCFGNFVTLPSVSESHIEIEILATDHLYVCGWKDDQDVTLTTYYPNGESTTENLPMGIDGGYYYVEARLIYGLSDPEGLYKYVFESGGDRVEATASVYRASGPRLFRLDNTHIFLYGFKPSEAVALYYYHNTKLVGWESYEVDQAGQLAVQIPADPNNNTYSQFFVAIGEQSGEVWLPFDGFFGPKSIVLGKSIIWDCGSLNSRLAPFSHAKVAYTDGQYKPVRIAPGFNEEILFEIPEGAEISIAEGPMCIDNITWQKVNSPDFGLGFMPEFIDETYFLEPAP